MFFLGFPSGCFGIGDISSLTSVFFVLEEEILNPMSLYVIRIASFRLFGSHLVQLSHLFLVFSARWQKACDNVDKYIVVVVWNSCTLRHSHWAKMVNSRCHTESTWNSQKPTHTLRQTRNCYLIMKQE